MERIIFVLFLWIKGFKESSEFITYFCELKITLRLTKDPQFHLVREWSDHPWKDFKMPVIWCEKKKTQTTWSSFTCNCKQHSYLVWLLTVSSVYSPFAYTLLPNHENISNNYSFTVVKKLLNAHYYFIYPTDEKFSFSLLTTRVCLFKKKVILLFEILMKFVKWGFSYTGGRVRRCN